MGFNCLSALNFRTFQYFILLNTCFTFPSRYYIHYQSSKILDSRMGPRYSNSTSLVQFYLNRFELFHFTGLHVTLLSVNCLSALNFRTFQYFILLNTYFTFPSRYYIRYQSSKILDSRMGPRYSNSTPLVQFYFNY